MLRLVMLSATTLLALVAHDARAQNQVASRMVYPLDIELRNREWKTLDRVSLNVTVHGKKELLDGLKVRVFRGDLNTLANRSNPDPPTQCNSFVSTFFTPVIRDVRKIELDDSTEPGFSAILNLGTAPSDDWIDLPGGYTGERTSYVVVFEKSADVGPATGQPKWITEKILLTRKDTPDYFRKYGVAVTIVRNVNQSGLVAIATAGTIGGGGTLPVIQTDPVCRALVVVPGGTLTTMDASNCLSPRSGAITASASAGAGKETVAVRFVDGRRHGTVLQIHAARANGLSRKAPNP